LEDAWTSEAILPHLTAGRLVRMTRLPTVARPDHRARRHELGTFVEAGVVGVITGRSAPETGLLSSLSARSR